MNDNKISIIHTNDIHSQINDFSKKAHLINEIRNKNKGKLINTWLINSGDALVGSIYHTIYKGEVEIKLLNMLEYDFITLGNHEFDAGEKGLDFVLNMLEANVISTNVDFTNSKLLNKYIQNKVFSSKIIEVNNKKVAFLGLLTLDTVKHSSVGDVLVNDPLKILKKAILKFKNENIDNIIVLSHLGIEEDKVIAKNCDVDVIIGGHTHTVLSQPLVIDETVIVQAGSNGQYVGELELNLDNFLDYEYKLHEIFKYKSIDLKVQSYLDEVNKKLNKVSSEIIGKTECYLDGRREVVRNQESNLGNLITDAFYFIATQKGYNPDFAILNGAGIRNPIAPGNITYKDIVDVLPFNRSLVIAKITGEQLRLSIQKGYFLQVSKLRIIKAENYIHILYLKDGQYVKIEENETYILATNDFVLQGSDGYIGFENAITLASNVMEDVQVLIEYIKYIAKPIKYEVENRIILE